MTIKAGKEVKKRDTKGRFTSTKKRLIVGVAAIWAILTFMVFINQALVEFNRWSAENIWYLQWPLRITRQKVWNVEKRQPLTVLSPVVEEVEETKLEDLTDVETKICDKWGMYECKTAIAISKAESGLNPEAINYNSNGTYDIGLFQINSIHWDRFGGLSELIDVDKNIDAAYEIWQEQGWNPWAVFNNNRFKANL